VTCAAIVESDSSNDGAKHYSMQGIISRGSRQCSRKACEKVGHLDLCKVHARLAREGMVDERGVVAPRASIKDARRFPHKFPGGLYGWFTESSVQRKD
jgi:hypothetical protein